MASLDRSSNFSKLDLYSIYLFVNSTDSCGKAISNGIVRGRRIRYSRMLLIPISRDNLCTSLALLDTWSGQDSLWRLNICYKHWQTAIYKWLTNPKPFSDNVQWGNTKVRCAMQVSGIITQNLSFLLSWTFHHKSVDLPFLSHGKLLWKCSIFIICLR